MDAEVIVVGAGLSGLTAAEELHRKGRDVLVLEARERVGGRAFTTVTASGWRVEHGAQWLGPTQRRMHRRCAELGIQTAPTHDDGAKVFDDGVRVRRYSGRIPPGSLRQVAELQVGLLRLERLCARLPSAFDTPAAQRLDRDTVAAWRAQQLPSEGARALFDVAVRTVFGAEPEALSALWFARYLQAGGGFAAHIDTHGGAQQERIVGGAQGVAEGLAAPLAGRIRLGVPVRSIEHTDAEVLVGTDGGTLRAARCVVAVPPAMALRIAFRPALPGARDLALQRTPMGATVKLFARYERAFWRDRGCSGAYLSTRGPVSVAFDNTREDGAQPSLSMFIVGRDACGWSRRDEGARRHAALAQIARAFGDDALRPLELCEYDWAEDPWTRGGPVGNALPGVLTTLGAPLREATGRIHWAGTETADEWTGYMEGAVQSGERAASEVLTALLDAR